MKIRTLPLLILLLLGTRVAGAQGFVVTGVMHHVAIEGGCWYFQADGDGKRYELWADSATLAGLHKEGLRATLRDAATTAWGTIRVWHRTLKTRRALADMDPRMLADLGISRAFATSSPESCCSAAICWERLG